MGPTQAAVLQRGIHPLVGKLTSWKSKRNSGSQDKPINTDCRLPWSCDAGRGRRGGSSALRGNMRVPAAFAPTVSNATCCPFQDSSQIELLKELMDLQKDMVVMLLSMLEGSLGSCPFAFIGLRCAHPDPLFFYFKDQYSACCTERNVHPQMPGLLGAL